MNPPGLRRLALSLAAAALLLAGGGFLRGLLLTGDAPPPRATADTAPAATLASRDPALALRALGAQRHWGSYTPPAAGNTAVVAPPAPRTVGADDIARAYTLVGVEHRDGEPSALLLPADAPEDSAELIRLRRGEQLAAGVAVSAIGADSVRFSTANGSSTLYLYGSAP